MFVLYVSSSSWTGSEETGTFDLSDLSITLHFFEAGQDTGKTVDVTNAFQPDATSPKDMELAEGLGLAVVPVNFVLKDVEAVQKAVLDAGYDQALIDQEELVAGKQAGRFTVYLVLRGDTDLNGTVNVIDAQYALIYYTETIIAKKSAKTILNDPNCAYLRNKGEERETYFPFSHYAMDVTCPKQNQNGDVVLNDGNVTVEDAQMILNYYTAFTVTLKDGNWNHSEVIGKDITVRDELHAEPCKLDPYASEYVLNTEIN